LLKAYDLFKGIKESGQYCYEARFNMVACHMKLGMWLPAHFRLVKIKQKAGNGSNGSENYESNAKEGGDRPAGKRTAYVGRDRRLYSNLAMLYF
jgi:hypothetical protein